MATKIVPILNPVDLDQIKAALDSIQLQRQRMQLLEQCGHDCDQYRQIADELDSVFQKMLQFYNLERQLIAQAQVTGG